MGEMRSLTQDDFVPRIAAWTKISRYGMNEDGLLVRYEGPLPDGFPVYVCLYEGRWEISDACSTIRAITEAIPVNEEIAIRIIRKEEKLIELRPTGRVSDG
jgi:hypothetical protein